MKDFLIRFAVSSASMSVIALILVPISRVWAKGIRAKWQTAAWAMVLTGLIVPFRPNISFFPKTVPVISVWIPDFTVQNPLHITASVSPKNSSPLLLLGLLWLVGTIVTLAFQILRHKRFLRAVRRWSTDINDEASLDALCRVKETLGVSGSVGFKRCALTPGPMLIGFFKPIILIPQNLDGGLELILKHELIHFKQKHIWNKCLAMLAVAVHWYNPALYFLSRHISDICELSCDEEVVKNLDMRERRRYTGTILRAIRSQSTMRTAFSTNFNGGKNTMKRRIASILDTRKKRSGAVALCVALVLVLGTGVVFASGNAKPVSQPAAENPIDYAVLTPEELAYCDIEAAPEEWKEEILTARNAIIFSRSWTVNGQGGSGNPDGTITPLPEFSDLFPDGMFRRVTRK